MTPSRSGSGSSGSGVPRERISRLTENWWAAGPTGPCGYDSELYFDWGGPVPAVGPTAPQRMSVGETRFEEFWNLVFMEFDQQPDARGRCCPIRPSTPGLDSTGSSRSCRGDRTGYGTDHFAPIVNGLQIPGGGRRRRSVARSGPSMCSPTTSVAPGFLIAAGVSLANEGTRLRAPPAHPPLPRCTLRTRRASGVGLAAGTRRDLR